MLKPGQIGVIPTDTLYGLVGRALEPETVKRIRALRQREPRKPFITLISSLAELKHFGIKPNTKILNKFWPGPISVVINNKAFRLPADRKLRQMLKQTGPLVAPSANPSGQPPATTIAEAKKYFGGGVDVYIDGGKLAGEPSALVEIAKNNLKILRPVLHPDWKIIDANKLVREFEFKDFKRAIAFVNELLPLAEKAQHHPDITINYNRVTLELWTHSTGGLTPKDFLLAYQIDQI